VNARGRFREPRGLFPLAEPTVWREALGQEALCLRSRFGLAGIGAAESAHGTLNNVPWDPSVPCDVRMLGRMAADNIEDGFLSFVVVVAGRRTTWYAD